MSAATMSWADFGKSLNHVAKTSPTAFNTPVGNSYFSVGKHRDVKIIEVTPAKAQSEPYLKIRLENDDGATIQTNVFLTGRNKDGEPDTHYRYKQLLGSFAPSNPSQALEFHTAAMANPSLFGGLVGLRTSIEVKEGTDGYLINKSGDSYVLTNKETGQQYEGTGNYNTVSEAKAAAKEMGIYQCRPTVGSFLQATKAAEGSNNEALRSIISNGSSGSASGNKTGGTHRRASI